ncbi:hypothetical protein HDU97_008554 [Phlyctochytrium planicorne]|nr:hypothetical protein HDU97_008554 [Phlyctochytrium planicorne]
MSSFQASRPTSFTESESSATPATRTSSPPSSQSFPRATITSLSNQLPTQLSISNGSKQTIFFAEDPITIDHSSTQTIIPQTSSDGNVGGTIQMSQTIFVAIIAAVVLGSIILAAIVFFLAGRRRISPKKHIADTLSIPGSLVDIEQHGPAMMETRVSAPQYLSLYPRLERFRDMASGRDTLSQAEGLQPSNFVPSPFSRRYSPNTDVSTKNEESSENKRDQSDADAETDGALELPSVENRHQDPVEKWDVDRVLHWLMTLGFSEDDRRMFKDGRKLLELTDWILRDGTSIGEGRLKTALLEIRAKFLMD